MMLDLLGCLKGRYERLMILMANNSYGAAERYMRDALELCDAISSANQDTTSLVRWLRRQAEEAQRTAADWRRRSQSAAEQWAGRHFQLEELAEMVSLGRELRALRDAGAPIE